MFARVIGVQANQFAVAVNGTPVEGGVFSSALDEDVANGIVIISAEAGDVITLVNHTSTTNVVTLATITGGISTAMNAELVIIILV